jgi:hypothetical protein
MTPSWLIFSASWFGRIVYNVPDLGTDTPYLALVAFATLYAKIRSRGYFRSAGARAGDPARSMQRGHTR